MLGVSTADTRFEFGKKIGSGTFGCVYYGIDAQTKREVAIKIEPSNSRSPSLEFEAMLYQILGPCRGLPTLIWHGHESGCNVLVMELLGPSLKDLMRSRPNFSLKTVLHIGHQALDILQYVHSFGFVHRDIKPANFLIGHSEHISSLYLADFGLAKRYWSDETKSHIPYRVKNTRGITGTTRYASINAHRGVELSRRDDIESLAYTLIHMVRGSLPWQGLSPRFGDGEMRNDGIASLKFEAKWEDLDQGGFPVFSTILMTAYCLEFDEAPDYAVMRRWIAITAEHQNIAFDGKLDWT